jgi:hypothetical protein
LDEQIYLCSWRTIYRILDEHQQVRERRNQLRHPTYSKPELLATSANQRWSWGITNFCQRANTGGAGIWPICGIGGILGGVGAEGKGKVNDRIGGFA